MCLPPASSAVLSASFRWKTAPIEPYYPRSPPPTTTIPFSVSVKMTSVALRISGILHLSFSDCLFYSAIMSSRVSLCSMFGLPSHYAKGIPLDGQDTFCLSLHPWVSKNSLNRSLLKIMPCYMCYVNIYWIYVYQFFGEVGWDKSVS